MRQDPWRSVLYGSALVFCSDCVGRQATGWISGPATCRWFGSRGRPVHGSASAISRSCPFRKSLARSDRFQAGLTVRISNSRFHLSNQQTERTKSLESVVRDGHVVCGLPQSSQGDLGRLARSPSRWEKDSRVGLRRTANNAARSSTARASDRPPAIVRRPRGVPLSQFLGASPTSAATVPRPGVPSSGSVASRVREATGPRPGRPRSSASRARQAGLASIASWSCRSSRSTFRVRGRSAPPGRRAPPSLQRDVSHAGHAERPMTSMPK